MIGRLLRGGFMTAIYAYLYIPIIILIVIALAGIRLIFTITEIPIMDMDIDFFTTFLANGLSLVVGVEFVKMLCTHTPGTVIEVLLFAISRQMIVGHVSGFEVLAGVAAIAGLFATHKYLYCKSLGDSDEKETVKDNTSEGKECK